MKPLAKKPPNGAIIDANRPRAKACHCTGKRNTSFHGNCQETQVIRQSLVECSLGGAVGVKMKRCKREGDQERRKEREIGEKTGLIVQAKGAAAQRPDSTTMGMTRKVFERAAEQVGSRGRAARGTEKERNRRKKFQDNPWPHHLFWFFADSADRLTCRPNQLDVKTPH